MNTITREELKEALAEQGNKVQFIGMDVSTYPRIKKGYAVVRKECTVAGRAGARLKEALNPRTWGERLEGTPLVAHKGNFYLEIDVTSVKDEKFYDVEDETEITKDQAVARGMREREILKNEQNMRDYKLGSINVIRMDKNEYEIKDVPTDSSK